MSANDDAGVVDAVRGAVETDGSAAFVAELVEWLRSVVSGDPDRARGRPPLRRPAREVLRRTGFPTVEIWSTAGVPAVFAEWPGDDAEAPRALVYGHHDVQPVDPPGALGSPAVRAERGR